MSYQIATEHITDPVEIRMGITDSLIEEARSNPKIVVVDADLMSSSGLSKFQKEYPTRALNIGIMEAHMAGTASGLSISGLMPFIHSFGPFASRRMFDQVVMAGAYANNPYTIISTDPGITAASNGGTHSVLEDLAMFRALPNTTIIEICDSVQAGAIIKHRVANPEGLCYIRAPRRGLNRIYQEGSTFKLGEFPLIHDGNDVTIFTAGIIVSEAIDAVKLLAKEGISVRLYDAFCLSHMDITAIKKAVAETSCIVAIDNHNVHGGIATAIADVMVEHCPAKLHRIGMTTFNEVGSVPYLLDRFGFSAEKIATQIKSFLKNK